MRDAAVLILPGLQNSGPEHWQSRWQTRYGYDRIDQHDWQRPLRGDWISRLEDVLLQRKTPTVLMAHSLGCLLVAAWAAHSRNTHLVSAALLVAPADAEREALRPVLTSWSPIPLQTLPFKTTLVGSRNDPFCSYERTQTFATAWGAELVDAGEKGHLNAESALGDWAEGHALLQQLRSTSAHLKN